MAKNKLTGIGGWLLIYVIGTSLSAINMIHIGYLGAFVIGGEMLSFISSYSIIFGVLLALTIIQVLRKKKSAIDMTIYLLWIGVIASIVMDYVFGITYESFEDYAYKILGIAFYLIVIFYFKKSKRVKNTLVK